MKIRAREITQAIVKGYLSSQLGWCGRAKPIPYFFNQGIHGWRRWN
ncbi:hypothetical protein [Leptolyngbya sp. NIES-2104]|nr:hypothetical protein [Leptolyngbya sp. NIES-2104]GAP96932.1 hypothetical protein NIES2104_34790 [Leptolyngbya sp. NIES-2104]